MQSLMSMPPPETQFSLPSPECKLFPQSKSTDLVSGYLPWLDTELSPVSKSPPDLPILWNVSYPCRSHSRHSEGFLCPPRVLSWPWWEPYPSVQKPRLESGRPSSPTKPISTDNPGLPSPSNAPPSTPAPGTREIFRNQQVTCRFFQQAII